MSTTAPDPSGLLPLAIFALVSAITPGPNNAVLATSGLNFGMRRTLPHIAGISVGFTVMIALVGMGLGSVIATNVLLYRTLKILSALYLLWLAWKIATSGPGDAPDGRARPLSFLQAAGFQWVNPKAWVITIGMVAAYTPRSHYFAGLTRDCLVSFCVSVPASLLWAGCGVALRRWLARPRALRCFNVAMALLLVASLAPLALE